MSIHKTALILSLLRRGAAPEVAALTADAVHPFAELGDWTPSRRAKKAAKEVSREVAEVIGVAGGDQIRLAKAWWAFEQYASLAAEGSEAQRMWREAARNDPLRRARKERRGTTRTTVLIVNDHALFSRGLAMALEEADFTVVAESKNGDDALRLAKAWDPDIILTDVLHPGQDGIELIRQLRGEMRATRFVICSLSNEYIEQARTAGADAYILLEQPLEELAPFLRRVEKGEQLFPANEASS